MCLFLLPLWTVLQVHCIVCIKGGFHMEDSIKQERVSVGEISYGNTDCLSWQGKETTLSLLLPRRSLLLVLVISVDLSMGNSIKLGKTFRLGTGGEGTCGRLLSWNAMVVCLGGKGGKMSWSMVTILVAWIWPGWHVKFVLVLKGTYRVSVKNSVSIYKNVQIKVELILKLWD